MAKLQAGDKAPAFNLLDQDGAKVKLSDFKGKRVVLYFYPKANTPGCTTQSCELRDARADFDGLDAVILGVSPDEPEKQKNFADKYSFGFPLLSDPKHKTAEAYGTWGEKSMYGNKYMGIIRSAFVIDGKGKIVEALYKISPKKTVPETLKTLRSL